MLELLISYKVNLNAVNRLNMTPIYNAIENESNLMTKRLVELGADLSHTDNQGRSPLYYAASYGWMDNMHYLLSLNVDVNCKTILGRTPLTKASWNGRIDIVQILLDHPKIKINQ